MKAGTAFDLFVIGGGINGAAIACDAAGRGLRVALTEMQDFAEGTSSRSSKLIHGGLRYLETYDFRLVREALSEREILMRKAPHLVTPLRLVLPHVEGQRPRWMIRLGLFFYDHLAKRRRLEASQGVDFQKSVYGKALRPGFLHGFVYSDCRGDDARLVIANLLGAQKHGATILPRHKFISGRRSSGKWLIAVRDETSGTVSEVASQALVNAGGPWVLSTATTIDGFATARKLRLVKGSHLVVPRLWEGDHGYFLQTSDGRLMEAFPYEDGFTSIGTTDVAWDEAPEKVTISEDEIDYMLREVNAFLRAPVRREQIVWSYAGVRPLFEVGGARDGDLKTLTRDYAFEIDGRGELPLLTVFGGKLTTHRRLAEDVLARLAPLLGWPATGQSRTEVLPGGEIDRSFRADFAERYSWLPETRRQRLLRNYGSRAMELLGSARRETDLGEDFGGGLTEQEVDFLKRTEWARTAEDIVWRRTKTGLRMSHEQIERLRVML